MRFGAVLAAVWCCDLRRVSKFQRLSVIINPSIILRLLLEACVVTTDQIGARVDLGLPAQANVARGALAQKQPSRPLVRVRVRIPGRRGNKHNQGKKNP